MADYITARLDLLERVGVTVDRTSPEAMLASVAAINKDPLGRLMLAEIERVIRAEYRIADAAGWLSRATESALAATRSGRSIHDHLASQANAFDRGVQTREQALATLASLAAVWIAGHAAGA